MHRLQILFPVVPFSGPSWSIGGSGESSVRPSTILLGSTYVKWVSLCIRRITFVVLSCFSARTNIVYLVINDMYIKSGIALDINQNKMVDFDLQLS